jgi:hypothetical protein
MSRLVAALAAALIVVVLLVVAVLAAPWQGAIHVPLAFAAPPTLVPTIQLSGTVFLRPRSRVFVDGVCEGRAEDWTSAIDPAHAPDSARLPVDVDYPIVGAVSLFDEDGNPVPGRSTFPIVYDTQLGRAIYKVRGVPPGIYGLQAFVGYKGADAVTRIYEVLYSPDSAMSIQMLTVPIVSSGQVQDIYVDVRQQPGSTWGGVCQ